MQYYQCVTTYSQGRASRADTCWHVRARASDLRRINYGSASSEIGKGPKRDVSVRLDELLWRTHRARWWAWRLFGCVLVTVCSTAALLWAAGL